MNGSCHETPSCIHHPSPKPSVDFWSKRELDISIMTQRYLEGESLLSRISSEYVHCSELALYSRLESYVDRPVSLSNEHSGPFFLVGS